MKVSIFESLNSRIEITHSIGVGTTTYAAPEQIKSSSYDTSVFAFFLKISAHGFDKMIRRRNEIVTGKNRSSKGRISLIHFETSENRIFQVDIYSAGIVLYETYNVFITSMERFGVLEKFKKRQVTKVVEDFWPTVVRFFFV